MLSTVLRTEPTHNGGIDAQATAWWKVAMVHTRLLTALIVLTPLLVEAQIPIDETMRLKLGLSGGYSQSDTRSSEVPIGLRTALVLPVSKWFALGPHAAFRIADLSDDQARVQIDLGATLLFGFRFAQRRAWAFVSVPVGWTALTHPERLELFHVGAAVGVDYTILPSVGVYARLGYRYQGSPERREERTHGVVLDIGLNFNLTRM